MCPVLQLMDEAGAAVVPFPLSAGISWILPALSHVCCTNSPGIIKELSLLRFVCLFVLIIPLRKGGEHSLRNQEGQDGFSFPRNLLPAGISAASAAGLDGFRARSADLPGSLWISGHPSWARGNPSLLLVVVRVKRRFPGSCTSVQRLRMCPGEPEASFLYGWSLWIGKGLFSPCLFNSCRSGLLLMFRLSSLWRLSEMFN